MAYDNDPRSDTKKGYSDNIKKMKREGYQPPDSPTGYDQAILGMDDIDRMRRNKLKDGSQ